MNGIQSSFPYCKDFILNDFLPTIRLHSISPRATRSISISLSSANFKMRILRLRPLGYPPFLQVGVPQQLVLLIWTSKFGVALFGLLVSLRMRFCSARVLERFDWINLMRKIVLTLILLLLIIVAPVTAEDFDKGLSAYHAGDFATAMKEWKSLAEDGDRSAQFNLGVMYDYGQGVPQGYKEAINWYTLAAEQGNAKAQTNLGFM